MRSALPALLLLAPTTLVAQATAMTFKTFEGWMKATSVPGYKLMSCEKDGIEYTAAFMGATPEKVLMVRCSPLKDFDQYKSMPTALQGLREFSYQGLRAVSYRMAAMPMLQIEIKKQGCFLGLGGSEGMYPTELDKLATALRVGEKAK